MNKVKVIGGLISFIGSLFLLIVLFLNFMLAMALDINWYLYLVIVVVAWAGSFQGLPPRYKRFGGTLALMAGLLIILFYVLFTLDSVTFLMLAPYSLFAAIIGYWIPYVTIESLLMIIGGIIILASPSSEGDGAGVSRMDSDKIARVDRDKIPKPTKCYKCEEKIFPNLKKCNKCNTLLICPQCDNPIIDDWKVCSNCNVDLDFGRFRLQDSIGNTLGVGIIMPLIFIIMGICIPEIGMFSIRQFSFTELFYFVPFSPSNINFLICSISYFLLHIYLTVLFLRTGKKAIKDYGIFSCIVITFTLISLFAIRIFLVFMVMLIVFTIIYVFGTCDLIYNYSIIAKNRKQYIREGEKQEADDKLRISEAKKKLLGMIKSEKKVTLDFASQILNLDQTKIRELIYELIGEEKIKGSFQANIFVIEGVNSS